VFSHVLIATDFSEPSKLATRAGRDVARAYQAEITLLHVVDRDDTEEERDNAAALLHKMRDELFEADDALTVAEVEDDRADVAICAQAEERGVDLIVAGREGAHGLAERLLGSTTERVARHASCSVLVAQPDASDPDLFAERVIACSDMSTESVRAIEEAGAIAARFGGTLTLAHVYTFEAPPFTYAGPSDKRRNEGMERHARELLDKLRADKLGDQQATIEVREHACAVTGLCDIAEEQKTDLMSVGTHGHTGIKRLLIGSIAERVIRHAPCSVLVARP